jgi:hypothetical protein
MDNVRVLSNNLIIATEGANINLRPLDAKVVVAASDCKVQRIIVDNEGFEPYNSSDIIKLSGKVVMGPSVSVGDIVSHDDILQSYLNGDIMLMANNDQKIVMSHSMLANTVVITGPKIASLHAGADLVVANRNVVVDASLIVSNLTFGHNIIFANHLSIMYALLAA